ncbi:MAG: hypothetical protein IJ573_07080 [Clostridia bacterium]|nr:hypothetical protein [Clostridia bacterium]
MNAVRYVTLDPTGNITCLVTEKPEGADERAITGRLMQECEQVAYLEAPALPGSRARIRLMGGEFCGNAAMASACWLADQDGLLPGQEVRLPIEMSGADGILTCEVRRFAGSFEGTVPMPPVKAIVPVTADGKTLTAVALEGIAHIIWAGPPFPDEAEAEALLRRLAAERPEEAVGLLLWDEDKQTMWPLVLVKGSGTLVWETGCGSGSAAVGAYRAWHAGRGITHTDVRQPGGVITVSAEVRDDLPENLTITGRVRLGPEKTLAAELQ